MAGIVTNPSRKSTPAIISASGTALAANDGRKSGRIQNLSTDKVYVNFGPGASASVFTVILAPGAATDDGYGGSQGLEGYKGEVSVYSAGTVRCVASEET